MNENKQYFSITYSNSASAESLLSYMKSEKIMLESKVVRYYITPNEVGFLIETNTDNSLFRNYESHKLRMLTRLINLNYVLQNNRFTSVFKSGMLPLTPSEFNKKKCAIFHVYKDKKSKEDKLNNNIDVFLKVVEKRVTNIFMNKSLLFSYHNECENTESMFEETSNKVFPLIKKVKNINDFIALSKLHLNSNQCQE